MTGQSGEGSRQVLGRHAQQRCQDPLLAGQLQGRPAPLPPLLKVAGVDATRGTVALATTLTLGFRPLGAFIFGRLADRFGRRPILMFNIAVYSIFSASTAFVTASTTAT